MILKIEAKLALLIHRPFIIAVVSLFIALVDIVIVSLFNVAVQLPFTTISYILLGL